MSLKILLLHNRYQIQGGEDIVVQSEKSLLESKGNKVSLIEKNNDDISGIVAKVNIAINTIYSESSKQEIKAEIERFKPDIVHVHNFFPRLSPSVYDACWEAKIPVVQTLHNYRLLCGNASFFRDGKVCEDCLEKPFAWPGIVHGCYRGSQIGTAAITTMQTVHRLRKTWTERVNCYIALTEFARQKFIQGGLPADKIVVKPNFVDPTPQAGTGEGNYALFVGRLMAEKGIETLLTAWQQIGQKLPLKIIGDGSLAERLQTQTANVPNIKWLKHQPKAEVYHLMGKAKFLIFPSEWYETFGLVAIEAFANGTPVIAANLGAMAELIHPGRTGLLFRPGDADDLTKQVQWILEHPETLKQMRQAARQEFEEKYTADANYQQLMQIYQTLTTS